MKYTALTPLPLLEALNHLSPQSSKTTLRSWIKEGRVQIDQVPAKISNVWILQGQTVTVSHRRKFIAEGIEILYEDADLVVIEKPAGLLSVATAFEKGETAHAILKSTYCPRKVYVVHRLDQETSGVMLFAFQENAREQLKAIFEIHDIERSYTAIVKGCMQPSSGTWKSYLYEDDTYTVHTTDNLNLGKEAITHYRVLASSKRYSWLNLTLETGRKNQIRVHCQEAGHPIIGDKKYGGPPSPIKRLCLHAHLLSFTHPITKKKLCFESSVPKEFYSLIKPLIE